MHPSPIRQYLPKEITTVCPLPVRLKSPRMIAPFEIIVFPPRIMFCGPAMIALRDTLFPVSWISQTARVSPVSPSTCSDHEQCMPIDTYGFNIFCAGVIDWLLHLQKAISWRQSARSSVGTRSEDGRGPETDSERKPQRAAASRANLKPHHD